MTTPQLFRISGLSLQVGAVAFAIHVVLRSLVTAGAAPATVAEQGLWVPISTLGLVGAALVLLGLPALYARVSGLLGFVGVVLIAVAWLFFGVFLSLYSVVLLPWLAQKAPFLVATSAPLPTGFVVVLLAALLAWFVGTALLAVPFVRGQLRPRWVGYLLPVSALWVVVGDLILAPGGPAANLAVNLLSNLGPILLVAALGYLGFGMWSQSDRADALGSATA